MNRQEKIKRILTTTGYTTELNKHEVLFYIEDLQNNWNELKKWVNRYYDYYMNNEDFIGGRLCFTDIKNKMQELEGKSE